ncbi:MAG: tryptophan synthase subunit alpha [Acidimicrobiales bacterium]
MKSLEKTLRDLRATGRKVLVPYFVAGATPDWVRHVEAAVLAGADAVEIGIPFSDPMLDGVVIQEASLRALRAGTTIDSITADLATLSTSVPLIAMTYYNLLLHYGLERVAGTFRSCGINGAIIPDLTVEESGEWRSACLVHDVATIFLVAPSTPLERVELVTGVSEGFCYAASRMAVTGSASDEGDARRVVARVRERSDVPTYVGFGIATPAHARDAASLSDGVIVGSALVRLILDGGGVREIEQYVGSLRESLDSPFS